MAILRMIRGPRPGQLFPLQSDKSVVGRHPECDVVLDVGAASRQHAQVLRIAGEFFLEDLRSRNGTYLNGEKLQRRARLSEGDSIGICDIVFVFHSGAPGSASLNESSVERSLEWTLESDARFGRDESSSILETVVVRSEPRDCGLKLSNYEGGGSSLLEECRRLRGLLEHNHVHFPSASRLGLNRALIQQDPQVMAVFREGFHRVVVFDARCGLDEDATFVLTDFFRTVIRQMAAAFGIQEGNDEYHPEQISQVLKDEARSLFCFLNVQLMAVEDLQRLRGFTQEQHQTLFCGPFSFLEAGGKVALLRSDPAARLTAVTEVGRRLAGAVSLEEVLSRLLDSLFVVFPQADGGCVVLSDLATGRIVPKAVKRRQEQSNPVRVSRAMLQRVMASGEAVLSADADTSPGSTMSESIVDFRIRSVMCAPLPAGDAAALGAIQIDTLEPRRRFTDEDLEVLAAVAGHAGTAIETAQAHEATLREALLRRDLSVACDVRQSLFPASRPEVKGYDFFDFCQPAVQRASVFFDYLRLISGRWAVVLADVHDKGLPAALLAARLLAAARSCLPTEPTLSSAIGKINRLLCTDGQDGRLVTLVAGILDPAKHEVLLAVAGHHAPLRRSSSGQVEAVGNEASGLPMGVLPDSEYQESRLGLAPGDSLVFYTDGVTDAANPAGEPYGNQRLVAQLGTPCDGAPQIGNHLVESILRHAGSREPADDLCLICFGRGLPR